MEARKITVVSTKTQQKSVIMSGAETLGQLKEDFVNAGIDIDNMTFYEGVSKTELLNDNSVLPTNVPYTNRRTGETINTNELVFMLTNKDKKIASGTFSRRECYDIIKSLNLGEDIKKAFGRNFTQCTTEQLVHFINDNVEFDEVKYDNAPLYVDHVARHAIKMLAEELRNSYEFNEDVLDSIVNSLEEVHCEGPFKEVVKENSPYSNEEIDEMFEGI